MADYTKTTWKNNITKLNAANMNHIEEGIVAEQEARKTALNDKVAKTDIVKNFNETIEENDVLAATLGSNLNTRLSAIEKLANPLPEVSSTSWSYIPYFEETANNNLTVKFNKKVDSAYFSGKISLDAQGAEYADLTNLNQYVYNLIGKKTGDTQKYYIKMWFKTDTEPTTWADKTSSAISGCGNIYWGMSDIPQEYNSDFIRGLLSAGGTSDHYKEKQTSIPKFSISLSGTENYLYFCYPKNMADPIFTTGSGSIPATFEYIMDGSSRKTVLVSGSFTSAPTKDAATYYIMKSKYKITSVTIEVNYR